MYLKVKPNQTSYEFWMWSDRTLFNVLQSNGSDIPKRDTISRY